MTNLNDALEKPMARERTKHTLYGIVCILIGTATLLSMIFWRVYPKSAYFLSGIPGAAFFILGIYNLLAVRRNHLEPTRDQRFLANVFWTTTVLAFPALVVVGIDINSQQNGTADALLHGIIGLALLGVAGVFKVIVAVHEAELRLHERLLAIQVHDHSV